MTNTHEKGSALELAVHAIERAILADAPGYSEKRFRIELRKVISVSGVRHEIDVWVSVDVAPGYEAIFIFECRNRKDKVDKNDIIVFTEKIKAAQAQKGFFVAKSFTGDAEAQARLDSRVQLLLVNDLPLEGVLHSEYMASMSRSAALRSPSPRVVLVRPVWSTPHRRSGSSIVCRAI